MFNVELTEEIKIGEAVGPDEMKIELEAEHSESMWMFMGGKWMNMKPKPEDTHHFEVKLEDTTITGSDEADFPVKLFGAKVKLILINDRTNEQREFELHEMYGGSGYHYATNASLK